VPRLRHDLPRLWRHLNRRRPWQLAGVLALLLLSSLAEMFSLGAALPFLAVLAEPQRLWGTAKVQLLAGWLGWQQPGDLVLPFCLLFALAALLAGLLRLLALWASSGLVQAIGSDLSAELYRRTLHQPYALLLQRRSSDLISAVANEVDQVVNGLGGLLQLCSGGLVGLALAGVLLVLNPRVTLVMAAVLAGGYGLLLLLSRRRLQRLGAAMRADEAERIRCLQEGLGSIRDVILDGSQATYSRVYGQADRRLRRHRGQGEVIALAPRYVMEGVGLALIALASLQLTASRTGVLGALPLLGALALGAQRLLPTLQLIYANWTGLRLHQPALHSVLAYLDQPIPDPHPEPTQPLPAPPQNPVPPQNPALPFHAALQLRDASYRYGPGQPWVLRHAELTIRPGERVGIVGRTGSGKSTLVDLLMGLLEPTAGELLVDGEPLRGERLRRWRSGIAHVPQSVFLLDGTIAENIAFGLPARQIDWPRLELAAERALLADVLNTLPQGLHTPVGERGVRLSGGQRQRIGLARALYRQAAVLVLDEATSALDTATEAQVLACIAALGAQITVLMIAHRASSLVGCQRLIRIAHGQAHPDPQP
jgi:ATP-binding cassette subfamily B protein